MKHEHEENSEAKRMKWMELQCSEGRQNNRITKNKRVDEASRNSSLSEQGRLRRDCPVNGHGREQMERRKSTKIECEG